MRRRKAGRNLSRNSEHRLAMMRNLVTSFLERERVRTTLAKARSVRPVAEKMITLAKRGTLHARRQALAYMTKESAVAKLFNDLGPRFKERPGGYTRIVKLDRRSGDGASMAMIELVGSEFKAKVKKKKDTKKPAAK